MVSMTVNASDQTLAQCRIFDPPTPPVDLGSWVIDQQDTYTMISKFNDPVDGQTGIEGSIQIKCYSDGVESLTFIVEGDKPDNGWVDYGEISGGEVSALQGDTDTNMLQVPGSIATPLIFRLLQTPTSSLYTAHYTGGAETPQCNTNYFMADGFAEAYNIGCK